MDVTRTTLAQGAGRAHHHHGAPGTAHRHASSLGNHASGAELRAARIEDAEIKANESRERLQASLDVMCDPSARGDVLLDALGKRLGAVRFARDIGRSVAAHVDAQGVTLVTRCAFQADRIRRHRAAIVAAAQDLLAADAEPAIRIEVSPEHGGGDGEAHEHRGPLIGNRAAVTIGSAADSSASRPASPPISEQPHAQTTMPGRSESAAAAHGGRVGDSRGGGGSARSSGGGFGRPAAHGRLYELDAFVVGRANRVAHLAAVRVADGDPAIPALFLHGKSGVGKTHLLRGIAARVGKQVSRSAVRYVSADAFTTQFVTGIRKRDLAGFRARYRGVRVLCIDDIHLLKTRAATQEELVHTLDALELGGAQIVFASDEHPRAMQELSAALASRFMGGAVLEIEPPDRDLCRRLVARFAQARGFRLSDAALDVAEQQLSDTGAPCDADDTAAGESTQRVSAREIEGFVTQLHAAASVMPQLVDEDGSIGVAVL
ncbi:MAG: DnaA/Hda family protein, partial [Planctomycetota bacterium]